MKKNSKIFLSVILIFIILIICAIVYFISKGRIVNDNSYYTLTYSSRFDAPPLLDSNEKGYKIITDKNSLDSILDKIDYKSNDFNGLNDDFFKSQNLLITGSYINPEMHKLEINNTKIDVLIYQDTPLVAMDEIFDFSFFLIPINKNIDNCNVESTPYPNRIY